MKKLFTISCIFVVTLLAIRLLQDHFHIKTLEVLYKCKELKIGMSREQVLLMVGEPREKILRTYEQSDEIEIWNFDIAPGASAPAQATFLDRTNALVDFQCCEDLLIRLDNQNITKLGLDSLQKIQNNLILISIGQSTDSVKSVLGEPSRIFNETGVTFWQYPGVLAFDGRPTIKFDSSTCKVIEVRSGAEYLVAESFVKSKYFTAIE